MNEKSTVEEIRVRFDADVERFSNLETGQTATMDARLALELITAAAKATTPHATDLLDVGCGAGNFTLRMLEQLPQLQPTLVDLSQPMLDRAGERIQESYPGKIPTLIQSDIRELNLVLESTDIILAAAVLHHLRTEQEWQQTFASFFQALRPGGSLWIFDLVTSTTPAVDQLMWTRYGEYLTELKDDEYRQHVFAYIEKEDTPAPLMFQINLLQQLGFREVELLHKNACFAAFGGIKPA